MKQNILIYLFLSSIFLSCTGEKGQSVEKTVPSVNIDTVRLSDSNAVLQFPGKVKASQDASLSFKVAGTIEKVYVKEGSYVKKGQLVAELDDTDYRIQLDATEAEYAQVKAQADRVIALYNDNGTTPNDYDKAVYGLRQITAKRDAHREQLGYTKMYAPFNGKVQSKLFSDHEIVGAGMPVLMIIGGGEPEVEIFLSASDYMNRSRFAQFYCEFDVIPGVKFPLEVVWTAPQANANQLYAMRLRITNPGGATMPSPGMSTLISAVMTSDGSKDMTYEIPSGAVFTADKKEWVYVYDQQTKKVSRKEVKMQRLLSNEDCIVSSPALRVGDVIVASGVHSISEGDEVSPLITTSETNVGGLL